MVEVTGGALVEIKRFLEGQGAVQSIRILLTEGDYRGPRLVMAIDEPREDDQVIAEKGVTFLVEKTLFEKVRPISIDYIHSARGTGFTLKSNLMQDVKDADVSCDAICRSCGELNK
jgi:Fe-S cluster assembly iron-binding protein IscA